MKNTNVNRNNNWIYPLVIILGIAALICIWWGFNWRRNSVGLNRQNPNQGTTITIIENMSSEDNDMLESYDNMNNVGSGSSQNANASFEMPNISAEQEYEMTHAQDFPPDTKTVQENNPPVIGNNTQSQYSKNPAVSQLRQASCWPKDMLSPEELKPQDNSSLWAQVNPEGSGSLKGRNFLQAGHNIGINTVGQTLRNPNLGLRSEPPNPQVKVSPWLQSTIEPDVNRTPFEIGGCA